MCLDLVRVGLRKNDRKVTNPGDPERRCIERLTMRSRREMGGVEQKKTVAGSLVLGGLLPLPVF